MVQRKYRAALLAKKTACTFHSDRTPKVSYVCAIQLAFIGSAPPPLPAGRSGVPKVKLLKDEVSATTSWNHAKCLSLAGGIGSVD
jgi:hypothetical protein